MVVDGTTLVPGTLRHYEAGGVTQVEWSDVSELHAYAFLRDSSMAKLFEEMSYSQTTLVGDTIHLTLPHAAGDLSWSQWTAAADAEALASGVDPESYDRLPYVLPSRFVAGWTLGGPKTVPPGQARDYPLYVASPRSAEPGRYALELTVSDHDGAGAVHLDGYGNRCDADYDNDGSVGLEDFSIFVEAFGKASPHCDMTGDGRVGMPDFGLLVRGFGEGPGASGLPCAGAGPCVD